MDISYLPHLRTSFTNTRSEEQARTRSNPKEQSRFRGSGGVLLAADSEPTSGKLPLQEFPAIRPEAFVLGPDTNIAADQSERMTIVPGNSFHVMPFSEQHKPPVANVTSSTAAPLPEVHNNIQMRNPSNASSPTVTEQGATHSEPQHLANRPHPARQFSEPSRVQVAHVMPPPTHVAAHPASKVPPVSVISSGGLRRRQSQPNPAISSTTTRSPAQVPAQVPTQAQAQTPAQVSTPVPTPVPTKNPLEIWRQSILERVEELDRTGKPISPLEKWRYTKLAEACSQGDLIYLNFHRILCRWSVPPKHRLSMKMTNPNLEAALNSLQQYLRPASEMSDDHVMWFMHFPWDPVCPSSLFTFHKNYDQVIFKFLNSFAQKWNTALDSVAQRRFPLLVHELIDILECPSNVLRVLLFTASCAFLGLADNPVAAKMPVIFETDKRNEMLAASSMIEPRDLACKRQAIIAQYRDAINEADAHQSRLHGLASAPFRPSTLTPLSTPVTYQQKNAFGTANDTGTLAHAAHTSHQLASNFNMVSTDASRSGSQATMAPVYLTSPNPYAGAQAQSSSQLSYQQAVSIDSSENAGNSLTPHAERLSHHNRQRKSLPASTGMQIRTSPTNATYLSSPSAVSASQCRTSPASFSGSSNWQAPPLSSPTTSHVGGFSNFSLHPRRNYLPQNNSRSTPAPLQSLTPLQTEVNEGERYSTVPLAPSQYPHTAWMSVQYGLHLVRSRSPDRTSFGGPGTRYYQFLSRFAFNPTPIFPQKGVQRFEFIVSADEFRLRSELEGAEDNAVHHFKNRSLRYRLRLIKRDQKSKVIDHNSWVTSSSIWPVEIYMLFNDGPVYPRRGQHFRHDLPVELTDLLREGLNTISISLPVNTGSPAEISGYYLAVEIIITMDHASTLDMICKEQKISADQTRREIHRRMQQTVSDDVIVEDDCLRISLTDPFSASMFSIPVRGVACKHIECFDLQTWLQTRLSKDSQSRTEPSLADGWKCPICNGDAAPPSLRIDEFLLDVQQTLMLTGKGQTRSISAYLDGSWTANEEPRDDDYDDNEDQNKKNNAKKLPALRKEPEIIEILDD
ncbi:hypothetical protein E4U54_007417 [Claviceps lovelessii]|nr:hypothetical protein E4U54_007417 [Claviceps lovelessii]